MDGRREAELSIANMAINRSAAAIISAYEADRNSREEAKAAASEPVEVHHPMIRQSEKYRAAGDFLDHIDEAIGQCTIRATGVEVAPIQTLRDQ